MPIVHSITTPTVRAAARRPPKLSPTALRVKRRAKATLGDCSRCGGSGDEPKLPDLSQVSQEALAEASGVSAALISRMMTDNPKQMRKDPKLSTLRRLQHGLHVITGKVLPLDFIAKLVE